jgi:hypothetical protein
MDPPLDYLDPNKLTFTTVTDAVWVPGTMTSGWNVAQRICLEARDDPCLVEPWEEWIDGWIALEGFSDDMRYQSNDEGGELEATEVDFNVQDNECGAIGYAGMDFNEDCSVGLGDFLEFYAQWLICTQPFEDNKYDDEEPYEMCDKLWNLVEEE